MPSARIIEFCDAVVAAIEAAWPVGERGEGDGVSRVYSPDIGLTPDQEDTLIVGRRVYVFPAEYAAPETLNRGELLKRFVCSVVIVERFGEGGKSGAPTRAWMDERVLWVEQTVFKVLRNPLTLLGETLVPDPETPAVVETVYDLETLIKHNAFWSQVDATYQELEEYP